MAKEDAVAILIGFRLHRCGEDPVEAAKQVPEDVKFGNPLVAAAVTALLEDK